MKSSRVVGQDLARGKRRLASRLHLMVWMILGACLLLPALKAHAVISLKGRRPPFKESGANPIMALKLAKGQLARLHGRAPAEPMQANQPIVYILIENADGGAPFNERLRDPKIWQGRIAEMRNYWTEVSMGRLTVLPAAETQGTANDGVVGPITVAEMSALNYENDTNAEFQVVDGAIRAANEFINFAAFDTNNDGQITGEELHIIIIFAGYEAAYDLYGMGVPAPSQWAHLMPVPSGIPGLVPSDSDGKTLTSYIAMGSQLYGEDPPMSAAIGTLCHEFGHDIGLPDLYDTDDTGSGGKWNALGYHSLMDNGAWGSLPGEILGSMPTHLDAYCKSLLGWATETVVTAPEEGLYAVPAAEGSNAVVRINVPNSQEFFLIENRQPIGYDQGFATMMLGGLLVLHCDGAILDGPLALENMVNANPMDPGVKVEEASGLNRLLIDLLYTGGDADFYRVGNKTTFNEMSNPNSSLKNGQPSSVEIFEVSASGPRMTFKLGSGTPRIGFLRPTLTVNESKRRVDFIVNLSKKAPNLASVDYAVTGGTAGGADYTLKSGTLTFNPGETSKYFSLLINNDTLVERNETVQLTLSNVRGAMLDNRKTQSVLTIVDNDNPYLNLIAPNGGESIPRGTRFKANWKSDVAVAGNRVTLELYKDGNYLMPLTGPIVNSPNGSYSVLFPASLPVGFNYKLAVTSVKDPRISDQSDIEFSVIDATLKVGSLSINAGAATTPQRQVILNNRCGGSPAAYMASESATFQGASWKPYANAPLFVLKPGNGPRRIFFKVKNAAGQESAPVSDTIVMREAMVKPVIQQNAEASVPEHQPYTSPAPKLLAGNIPIVWSLVGGPAGLKINPATGVITWADPKDAGSSYPVTIRAANTAGYDEMTWTLKVARMAPAQGVDCSQLAWNASDGIPWFTQRQVSHDGVDSARSRPVGNNQKSVLSTTVTGPGVLTFWWKVSSERNSDTLSVYYGNILMQTISGETNWVKKSIKVTGGEHTITWTYAKDGAGAAGADAGYVDQVTWSPAR